MSLSAVKLSVNGTVQGVGFRPFVFKLAVEEKLAGTVLNDGHGVEIVLEGDKAQIDTFKDRLIKELPPLANIESIEEKRLEPTRLSDFKILSSRSSAVDTSIPADAATCEACLKELFDKNDRRYRYPFINCTHCGPRYTITRSIPYDRPQTTMSSFPMCEDCLSEYTDPMERRFHAQPNACPVCGPHVWLTDNKGREIRCSDPFTELVKAIKEGKIVAIKGLGGFHLACDARNAQAVKTLRERKNRPSKPFALMSLNTASAGEFVYINDKSSALLKSASAPIVLCPKKPGTDEKLIGVAPGLSDIGFMLPYTPIQWLVFFEYARRPEEPDWYKKPLDLTLVMTSANAGGEPLVIDNDEAINQLSGICDLILLHNRDILIRCDDSVAIQKGEDTQFIRRARGYVPRAVKLAVSGPSVIATGSWLKNTACLTKNDHAYLTQHIGDLDRASNCVALKKAINHIRDVFKISPEFIACDLHPDFYSSRLAEELADEYDVELIAVQHHHAHIAAVMAEHRLIEPVLGLALDGVGYGLDGTSWGGELLRVDPNGFERLSSLGPMKLPGADKCAREGWRIAYAMLASRVNKEKLFKRFAYPQTKAIDALLHSDLTPPMSSSLGRLFDAAAAALSVADFSSYEGEAPMMLESAAGDRLGKYLPDLVKIIDGKLDAADLLVHLFEREDTAQASADFHETLGKSIAQWAKTYAQKQNLKKVCLSGGCALNRRLTSVIRRELESMGLTLYEAKNIPPNDGGLSLGQAWVVIMKQQKIC